MKVTIVVNSDPLRIKSFEENLNDGCKNKAKRSSKKVGGDFEQRFGACDMLTDPPVDVVRRSLHKRY